MATLFDGMDRLHPEGAVYEAHAIIRRALDDHRPVRAYAMFSGGHDSLCASHVAAAVLADTTGWGGCVHVNTGIGIEETRQYVRDTCARQGWPLREMHPPVSYEALVLRYGFPGSGGHRLIYNRLKERCIRRLVREAKAEFGTGRRDDRVLLVTGIRKQESARRSMGYVVPVQREGGRVWAAPLVNWDQDHKRSYLEANRLPRNPVVEVMCYSGECLCGAFARPGEIKELELFYPEAARQIHDLEAQARATGVHAVWGTRHPNDRRLKRRADAPGQQCLFGLCWSCEARREREAPPA